MRRRAPHERWAISTCRRKIALPASRFFHNGHRVIVGTAKGSLWGLDIRKGKEVQRIKVASDDLLAGGILSLDVSPDGARVLAGCADNTVRLIDLAAGKVVHVLKGHGGPVWSVAFMKDGHHALSGSTGDNTIRFWDLDEGKQLRQMRGKDRVNCLAISPDQKTVAASEFMAIGVWDIATGERIWEREEHGSRVAGIAYSPDGHSLVSAAIDDVITWNSATGKRNHECTFDAYVAHFALSPDGRWALLGGHNEMRLMNIEKCEELQHWENLDGDVMVAFSPDGRYAVSGEAFRGIRVWDLPKTFEKQATP